MQCVESLFRWSEQELVEGVKVSFTFLLVHDSRLKVEKHIKKKYRNTIPVVNVHIIKYKSIISAKCHIFIYFFEQVFVDVATDWVSFKIKVHVHVFTESWGIIVSSGLRISERFQDNVTFEKYASDPVNLQTNQQNYTDIKYVALGFQKLLSLTRKVLKLSIRIFKKQSL